MMINFSFSRENEKIKNSAFGTVFRRWGSEFLQLEPLPLGQTSNNSIPPRGSTDTGVTPLPGQNLEKFWMGYQAFSHFNIIIDVIGGKIKISISNAH